MRKLSDLFWEGYRAGGGFQGWLGSKLLVVAIVVVALLLLRRGARHRMSKPDAAFESLESSTKTFIPLWCLRVMI
jgi:hypothetical protein